jgi:hypothetical protein
VCGGGRVKKDIDVICKPLSKLLPEGWLFEYHKNEDGVVISANGVGRVTVDFKRRDYRGGWSFINTKGLSKNVFVGGRWRERLIEEAIEYLQGVVE